MSQTPTAAEQYQTLVKQEAELLTGKARALEQLEAINSQLTAVRAALQGAQLGFTVAQQSLEKDVPSEAEPASDKE
jgi:DNA-binding FrmR family transcriptional regulator